MKKKYAIMIFLFFTAICGYSQKFGIGFQTGVGTYSMSGLESLNSYVIQNLPIKTKLVSDFPAYWYYKPSISLNFERFSIGFLSTFQSTGSRVSAKDYSGEYRFDIKVKSHNPGIYGEAALLTKEKMQLSLSSVVGITLSRLKMEESIFVDDEILTNDHSKFKALNYYFEPGFNFYYRVYFVILGINAGYFLQFGKQAYYTNGNKDYMLGIPRSDNPIKPDWNGFRAGLSVRYIL